MTMNRHEPYEELISASLTGDLSADERARLDLHLDGCARCRATLAAFADQRRIVAGVRHVAPPSDLGARVRAGIEGGSSAGLPWWRRRPVILAGIGGGLAAVAGALLALVVLSGGPDHPPVGDASTTPYVPAVTASAPAQSFDVPAPTATPVRSPVEATPVATPTPTPAPASPEPDLFLALTGPIDNQALTVRADPGATVAEVAAPVSGPPVAAELSPDGQLLAYIATKGESGLNEIRLTRVSPAAAADPATEGREVGDTFELGDSIAGSPFLEHLFWSPSGRYLAYTIATPDSEETDVWVFDVLLGAPYRLTDVGNAYAGSWVEATDGTPLLWVSVAGDEPQSYLRSFDDDAAPARVEPGDPADGPTSTADNVFQPMVSPNGSLVIFWAGSMTPSDAGWAFSEGAQPWLAENMPEGNRGFAFTNAQEVFTDLTIGRDAFTSAAIAWGRDSDAFAVWDVAWAGLPQGPTDDYPSATDVYFGYATDPRHITRTHAIDDADIPEEGRAVDVKVPATGRHLVITVAHPRAGALDPPRADLILVTRNTGDVADVVEPLENDEVGWYGPAVYDAGDGAEAP